MTFSYALGTDIGTVRRLAHDVDAATAFWSDEEIADALAVAINGSTKRVAAALLLARAAQKSISPGRVSLPGGLSVDGPAGANALRAVAASLLQQADDEDALGVGTDQAGLFDWAEIVTGPFGHRERLIDQALREAG